MWIGVNTSLFIFTIFTILSSHLISSLFSLFVYLVPILHFQSKAIELCAENTMCFVLFSTETYLICSTVETFILLKVQLQTHSPPSNTIIYYFISIHTSHSFFSHQSIREALLHSLPNYFPIFGIP